MPRAVARLKYPINYPHDVAKLRLEYDTPSPVTVDVDAIRRFEEGRIIYESPLIDYHSYLRLIQPIVRDGLVAEWLFFEGAGSVLHDTSGYENHGTIYGMTWQQLENGKWVGSFDGVDDYVVADTDMLRNMSLPQTVEVLVRVNGPNVANNPQGLVAKRATHTTMDWELYINLLRELRLWVGEGGVVMIETGYYINYGVWYHIVATMTSNEAAIYVNGELIKSYTGALSYTPSEPITIGALDSVHNFLNGHIAFTRLYGRILSADEVQQLYELAKLIVPLG